MYEIFEKLCKERVYTASRVSRETGIATSTLTSWKKGIYAPKKDKMEKIANLFGVSVEYLMTGKDTEKESTSGKKYYFSYETAEMAQKLFENRDLRLLFDASRDAKPEDLEFAEEMLKRLKGKV